MKTLITILLAVCLCVQSFAANVEVRVRDFTSGPVNRRLCTVTLLEPGPVSLGPWVFTGDSVSRFTDTNGIATFTNMLTLGSYRLSIAGAPSRSYLFCVWSTNGTYNVNDLIGSCNTNQIVSYYTSDQIDAMLGTNAGVTIPVKGVAASGSIDVTTNGVVVTPSLSASASNAIVALIPVLGGGGNPQTNIAYTAVTNAPWLNTNTANVTLSNLNLTGAGTLLPPLTEVNFDASSEAGWLQIQADRKLQRTFDGGSLTNLDASDLASGTLPAARFPAQLPAIDGSLLTGIAAGSATNVIANTNGTGYGARLFDQTNRVTAYNGGKFLTFDSSWTSNSTYAAPWDFYQVWIWQTDHNHAHPDVQTIFGYNMGLGGVQNPAEPAFGYHHESRWQNIPDYEQFEFYWSFSSPTNGYGTNRSFRPAGFTPQWIQNGTILDGTYASSLWNFNSDQFSIAAPDQGVAPFTMNLAPGAVGIDIYGTQTIHTNGAGTGYLALDGAQFKLKQPTGLPDNLVTIGIDWPNQENMANDFFLKSTDTAKAINIFGFTNLFINKNSMGFTGSVFALNFIGSGSSLSNLNLTNSIGTIPATRVTGLTGGGDMLAANSLSDVADAGAARTNIAAHNASNLTAGTVAAARLPDLSSTYQPVGALTNTDTRAVSFNGDEVYFNKSVFATNGSAVDNAVFRIGPGAFANSRLSVDVPVGHYAADGSQQMLTLAYNGASIGSHFMDDHFTYTIENPSASDIAGLALRTVGTNRLFISQGGNVGIYTNNPQQRLHVIGNQLTTGTNEAGYFVGDGSQLTGLPGGGSATNAIANTNGTGYGPTLNNATNTGTTRIALVLGGLDSQGTAGGSTVLGQNADTSGAEGVAIGNSAASASDHSIAIGSDVSIDANSHGAIAIGAGTTIATAEYGIAIGNGVTAEHTNSVAIGYGAQTTATNQIRLGLNHNVVGALFTGSGAGLTNLNGANLTAESVTAAKLEVNLDLSGKTSLTLVSGATPTTTAGQLAFDNNAWASGSGALQFGAGTLAGPSYALSTPSTNTFAHDQPAVWSSALGTFVPATNLNLSSVTATQLVGVSSLNIVSNGLGTAIVPMITATNSSLALTGAVQVGGAIMSAGGALRTQYGTNVPVSAGWVAIPVQGTTANPTVKLSPVYSTANSDPAVMNASTFFLNDGSLNAAQIYSVGAVTAGTQFKWNTGDALQNPQSGIISLSAYNGGYGLGGLTALTLGGGGTAATTLWQTTNWPALKVVSSTNAQAGSVLGFMTGTNATSGAFGGGARTTDILSGGHEIATNSYPPVNAWTPGGMYLWNSNGSGLYIVRSGPNSTTWTSTNVWLAP